MRNRESSCDWKCRLIIPLIVLGCFISVISYAQHNVIHRIRKGVTNEKEVQVAIGEWKEWTDISYMTPSFLSCKVQLIGNTISFKVETNDYIYTFADDNPKESEQLEWNIRNGSRNEDGQTFINDYLRTIVPSLGMEYVTAIKRHRNDVETTSSIPEPNEFEETETANNAEGTEVESVDTPNKLGIVASPVQNTQSIRSMNNVAAPKEENSDKDKEGSSRGVLETIIGAFIILWIIKGVFKAFFSSGKKKKKNSWTDQAWFHDHNQKI